HYLTRWLSPLVSCPIPSTSLRSTARGAVGSSWLQPAPHLKSVATPRTPRRCAITNCPARGCYEDRVTEPSGLHRRPSEIREFAGSPTASDRSLDGRAAGAVGRRAHTP